MLAGRLRKMEGEKELLLRGDRWVEVGERKATSRGVLVFSVCAALDGGWSELAALDGSIMHFSEPLVDVPAL